VVDIALLICLAIRTTGETRREGLAANAVDHFINLGVMDIMGMFQLTAFI
jgi:hypothetical protein